MGARGPRRRRRGNFRRQPVRRVRRPEGPRQARAPPEGLGQEELVLRTNRRRVVGATTRRPLGSATQPTRRELGKANGRAQGTGSCPPTRPLERAGTTPMTGHGEGQEREGIQTPTGRSALRPAFLAGRQRVCWSLESSTMEVSRLARRVSPVNQSRWPAGGSRPRPRSSGAHIKGSSRRLHRYPRSHRHARFHRGSPIYFLRTASARSVIPNGEPATAASRGLTFLRQDGSQFGSGSHVAHAPVERNDERRN